MDKNVYDVMVKELQRECVLKGKPMDAVLYSLSCMNNEAWREGRSTCLTKIEPRYPYNVNGIAVKIHIK